MRATLKFAALALTASIVPSAAPAVVLVYAGIATGGQELPSNGSPGTGAARVTYDTDAHTLRVQSSFSGLTGTTTAAHIHVSLTPGANGGVATQTPTFAGFPLGVTSGSYDNIFDLTLASSYNPAFITGLGGGTIAGAEAALAAGLATGRAYFNLHTTLFPGGEIRANLSAAPEPASWAMMIGGLAVAGGALRTRRRFVFA
ncbi:MAG: CHRD domain-containing protein [Sphingomonadales bacterium]|nr:CHRD domain-containing protein [Sphingomonadales bacterium]